MCFVIENSVLNQNHAVLWVSKQDYKNPSSQFIAAVLCVNYHSFWGGGRDDEAMS